MTPISAAPTARKLSACTPDKGGDAEAFQQLQRAYAVLSDRERRKRYDETGRTDENDAAADRLSGIAEAMLRLIDGVDVTTTDLVKKLRIGLDDIANGMQVDISQRERRIAKRRAAALRLTRKNGENLIAAMLEADADKLARQNEVARAEIAKMELVRVMIDEYEYRTDPLKPVHTNFGSFVTAADLDRALGRGWT